MIFGPDEIFECPECGQRLARQTLMSGNTFGAEIYSDGKMVAPMLPRFPDLIKCGRCGAFFWLHNLEPLNEKAQTPETIDQGQYPTNAKFPYLRDLLEALEKKCYANPAEEFKLRQEIWWAFNDKVRKGKPLHQIRKQKMQWEDNLRKLQALLDPNDPEQAVMIAEIHRNLGEFGKCLELLNILKDPELHWVIEEIREACLQENDLVFLLKVKKGKKQ